MFSGGVEGIKRRCELSYHHRHVSVAMKVAVSVLFPLPDLDSPGNKDHRAPD